MPAFQMINLSEEQWLTRKFNALAEEIKIHLEVTRTKNNEVVYHFINMSENHYVLYIYLDPAECMEGDYYRKVYNHWSDKIARYFSFLKPFISTARGSGKSAMEEMMDVEMTEKLWLKEFNMPIHTGYLENKIKKVIFNDPATIILWKDGTKTVVKCMEGDRFDLEKGMAMAISKKILGNSFQKEFKKWLPKEKYYNGPIDYHVLAKSVDRLKKQLKEEVEERIHRFKVGDKVKVVKIVTADKAIRSIDPNSHTPGCAAPHYGVFERCIWIFFDDELELVERPVDNK